MLKRIPFSQVLRLVSHHLAILTDKTMAEEQLDAATAQHDAVSTRLAGVLGALQAECAMQQDRLRAMVASGREEDGVLRVRKHVWLL